MDAARTLFRQLALTEPRQLLTLLQDLSKLAAVIPAAKRQQLADLQLETAQQLKLQQPDLTPAERQLLDAATADAYIASGNSLNAAAHLDRLLEQSPRDLTRLKTAAELHQQIGAGENLQRAKSYWQRIERLEVKGTREWLMARLRMAECSVALGQKRDALKLVQLTRLVYPELGGVELQQRFAAVEAAASR
jgi:hypothetical protein